MNAIRAGWALVGKRPGTYDDYSVIAASDGPFNPTQYHTLVFKFSPGNPPPPHETGAGALPWVWFTQAAIRDTNYAGIAIREWTDHVDATNRPIAFTRYFCVPLNDVVSTPLRFSDLYQAVGDISLSWDDRDPLAGRLIDLQPPSSDPETLAKAVHEVGIDRVAAAAAGLFAGSVTLLGGSTDLHTRLRTLDAIAALLPAGARAWLTASTWADFGVNHKLALTFAQRARDSDLPIDLRGGERYGNPSPYLDHLTRLCRQETVQTVVRHLAGQVRLQEREPVQAEFDLVELNLPQATLQAARNRTLQPQWVRSLGQNDQFSLLTVSERVEVLQVYLAVAKPDDLRTDRELLAKYWSEELSLANLTHTRLWVVGWAANELMELARLARITGTMPAFVYGLTPPDQADPESPGWAVVGQLVVQLAEDPDWVPILARWIAPSEALTVAVLKALPTSEFGPGAHWMARFDAAVGPGSPWVRLGRLYREVVSGDGTQLSQADLEWLDRIDPDAVVDLIRRSDRTSSRFGRVVESVLGFLLRRRATTSLPSSVATALRDLNLAEHRQLAWIDFMFYRANERPPRTLEHSEEYREALVEITASTELSRVEREVFVNTVAACLPSGWASTRASFGTILDTLWRLSHPDGCDPVLTTALVREVADQIVAHPNLLNHPRLAHWMPELEVDTRVRPIIASSQLAQLSATATPAEVADLIIERLKVGANPDQLVQSLIDSRWRPNQPGLWAEVMGRVNGRYRKVLHHDGHMFAYRLGQALLNGRFGGDQAALALELLPSALLPQLMSAALLAKESTNHVPAGRVGLDYVREELRAAKRLLEDTLKVLDSTDRRGLRNIIPGRGGKPG